MFPFQNQPCLSSQRKVSCFVCHAKYYLWNKEQNFDLNFNIFLIVHQNHECNGRLMKCVS